MSADSLILNENCWLSLLVITREGATVSRPWCLPTFGFKAAAFSQYTCNLGFKERTATSWLIRCFKLSVPLICSP